MSEHEDTRDRWGSRQAKLVWGKAPDGTLAHISTVQRGRACNCSCPSCDGHLVARTKADHMVPHFAHSGGEACGGGPETALHLLAKEVFCANPRMLLPERPALDSRRQLMTKPSQEVETEFLRLEYTDPKKIIPDLYVRALGHDLFVEVAVTHFSDETKIQRLREHRIPAVEVDLSRVPRDSRREDIAEAVLRTAPRRWLYHPGIDAAEAKRKADEEAWQAAQDKQQAIAQEQHKDRVDELLRAYRTARRHAAVGDVPRLADLQAVGLSQHVGVAVSGSACFAEPPAFWQARILAEVFHDRCLGNAACKAVPITQHLDKIGTIRASFRRVPGAVADDAAAIEADFAPPWKAVDTYLKHLIDAGVLVQHGYGMVLAARFAEPWKARTLAEKQRTEILHAVMQAVEWILSELPDEERGSMTGQSWLHSVHDESGKTYQEAIQSDIEASKIAGEIDAIIDMLEKRGPLPPGTVGLPVERAVERRKQQMAKQAQELREKQLKEAGRLRQLRRDRLLVDAEKELSSVDLEAFLNTKCDDLSGMTPLEASQDSETGLNRARNVLSDLVRQRILEAEAKAERKGYQDQITADARNALSADTAEAFLNGRDDDLGRTTPLLFVKNVHTYREALKKLEAWRREFGRP